MRYRAIKTNIAESLNIVLQIEPKPGARFVSEVLEIRGYDMDLDHDDHHDVYSIHAPAANALSLCTFNKLWTQGLPLDSYVRSMYSFSDKDADDDCQSHP
jgi:hypothetical protein